MKDENASAPLELLLLVPLIFMFLFVMVDAGLAFRERGALEDALRASLNLEELEVGSVLNVSNGTNGEVNLNEQAIELLVERVIQGIESNIRLIKSPTDEATFLGTAAVIDIRIDPQDGSYLGFHVDRVKTTRNTFNIKAHTSQPIVSLQDFVSSTLANEPTPSPFANMLGPTYLLNAEINKSNKFLDKALALYVEISALNEGLSPGYVKSVLGSNFVFHKQILVPLRQHLE